MNIDDATFYDVEFHFPYSQESFSHVPGWRVRGWKASINLGKVFSLMNAGDIEFTINPALMTYMKVRECIPF